MSNTIIVRLLCGVAVGLSLATVAHAQEASSGGLAGNIHLGSSATFSADGGSDTTIPDVNVGGKLGYDDATSPWGWQVDGEWNHVDFDWIRPAVTGVDGSQTIVDTAAHLTYRRDSATKFGVFAGYGSLGLDIEDTTGATFDFMGVTGVTSASMTIGMAAAGLEGMFVMSDSTWVQGRVGVLDPLYVSATVSDGITTTSDSETDILGDYVGGMASASLHHRFTSNIATKIEAGYVNMGDFGGENLTAYSVAATANYVFDVMPLSLGLTAGYASSELGAATTDGLTLGSRLTWSFGSGGEGTDGKLFGSGILGSGF